MQLAEFLKLSWEGYSRITPDAGRIHSLLQARGESEIVNDHVAYRTFGIPGINRFALGRFFEQWGYQSVDDELDFKEKKLKANYWLHPDPHQPKIFISELRMELIDLELRAWIEEICAPLKGREIDADFFLKPSWKPIRHDDYQRALAQSEYAAWTAAFGIQVNHFTILVNALKTFGSLQELNTFLLGQSLHLNDAGGVIKGKPEDLLEQTSTNANRVAWQFEEGGRQILGCYYEFARRYPLPDGRLFQGFLPQSADKIFESTFEKKGGV